MNSAASVPKKKSGIFCLGTKITIYKTTKEKVHVLRAKPYSQIYSEDTEDKHLGVTVE